MLSPFWVNVIVVQGFLGSWVVKNTPVWCRRHRRWGLGSLGRSPRGGNVNLLQYSCLGKSHGHRDLEGYSPWSHKESDMTERLSVHACMQSCLIYSFLLGSFLFFICSIGKYTLCFSVTPPVILSQSPFLDHILLDFFLKHLDIHVQWEYFILRVALNLL